MVHMQVCKRKIIYLGYSLTEKIGPHQSMSVRFLAEKGAEIFYFCHGSFQNIFSSSSIHDCSVPDRSFRSVLRLQLKICRAVLFGKCDTIYVQGAQNTPFLYFLRWLPGLTLIYHTQDFLEPGRHRLYEFFERSASRRADIIISNEKNRLRFLRKLYRVKDRTLAEVLPTYLPGDTPVYPRDRALRRRYLSERLASGQFPEEQYQLVVMGGAYSPVRCSAQVVRALTLLPENYLAVFTGMDDTDRRQDIRKQLAGLKILDRCLFLPQLDFHELLQLYASCDIGILLYPDDGIGNYYQCPGRFTEYLGQGLPIVTSNFIGLELLIVKYHLGEAIDPESPIEIAAAIRRLAALSGDEIPARRKRLIQTVRKLFTYEPNAEQVFGRIGLLQ